MISLTYLDEYSTQSIRLEISPQGHSFITLVVAFLLVSRVNMGLARYNTARGYIGSMYQHVRELIQGSVVLSNHEINAQEWRHTVSYRCLLLLRTAMVVIDYPVDRVLPWDIPELNGSEANDVKQHIFLNPSNRRWAHGHRTEWEEAMRVPIRIAYLLRKAIHAQTKVLSVPIIAGQENRLHANVDAIMGGYYGMRKFLTTPIPFPLIQVREYIIPILISHDCRGITDGPDLSLFVRLHSSLRAPVG